MSTTDFTKPVAPWSDADHGAKLRAEGHNHLVKWEMVRELRARLASDVALMDGVIGGATPERTAAMRVHCEGRLAWLVGNPGDDLTPERVAHLMRICRGDLPGITDLEQAVGWIEEIENNVLLLDAPSPTREVALRRLHEARKDAARWLWRTLSVDDVGFLGELGGRSWRRRRRWRLERDVLAHRAIVLDLRPQATVAAGGFDYALGLATTAKEVKRLLAIWQTPAKVVTEDGVRVFVGEGFKIWPLS